MGHIHEDILIEAPVEVVYALFRDPTRYPGIVVEGIEMSNISGPLDEVGTTFDTTVRLHGIELRPLRNVVTEVEPFRLIRVVDGDGGELRYRFESEGSGTRLSVDAEHEMAGVFGKIPLLVVVDGAIDHGIRQMDERLKVMAETERGLEPGTPSGAG